MEEWRAVIGWPYEVSDCGQVRRSEPAKHTYCGRLLKPAINTGGYKVVKLYDRNRLGKRYVAVHILVAEAFLGPKPSPTHQAAHNDGSKLNNHAANLRWATPQENVDDKKIHGTYVAGEDVRNAKLTWRAVEQIRTAHKEALVNGRAPNGFIPKLCARFGVKRSTIRCVIDGRRWSARSCP